MTIPASQIAQVIPGVLSAAGAAINLNGLILTHNTYVPIGTIPGFAIADDVASYFGSASLEASLATIYFNGYENSTKKPGKLYFAQYPSAPVAAYLRSGSLASTTLAQIKAVTGSLSIVIDGTAKTAASIDLSTATSFSSAAALLSTALSVPVTFDSIKSAFIVSSSTTGVTSTIDFATGTAAAGLLLTNATGAVTSQGAVAGVPGTFMDALVAKTQNWFGFTTTWEPVTADKNLFSAWANGKADRFAYAGYDSDVNASAIGNTTTWGYYLQSTKSSGTIPIFGDVTHAVFALSWAACLDFDRLNGRATLAFRYQSGLAASVTDATIASNLKANGYNFYGAYANATEDFLFMYPGSISGKWAWADSFANQVWMNANFQADLIKLAMSLGTIPYNADGYGLIEASIAGTRAEALNFGAIRTGTTLDPLQVAAITNAVGSDVSPTIIESGSYFQVVPATAAVRAARTTPSITFYYADGGSIQQFTVASIEIQ
ncbi:Protein of unknown function (DUF3383) [Pseudomonas asplenii]|uniref:DUF3383 domain-containing protein n=1 Tax=Pseudomonas asplenii TaxID=53407 RepID=A0A0M9GBV1_9PSED|nr:DUF3383 domain-containing protein [Pseudomonas fuscovaginae]KPA87289.1 Protein of unknown function (DUF3383) [Pseudomonas fuscovaginae]